MTAKGYTKREWGVWKWIVIPDRSDPESDYLRRLQLIQTPWGGVQLHWILLPDTDRDMHDHPRTFLSFIVRGGYEEEYVKVAEGKVVDPLVLSATRTRLSLHRVTRGIAHRITSVRPGTVTLVAKGPFRREWGFYTPEGFVSWRDYGSEVRM